MKKTDVVKELKDGQFLATGEGYWEIMDEETYREHGTRRTLRVFRVIDAENVEEIPLEKVVTDIIEAIEDSIDVRDFLRQVLLTNTPMEDLMQVHEIIQGHPEAATTATTRAGCLYLDFPDPRPGKENVPIYLLR